jgi:excisionase family DNA binding protein
VNRRDDDLTLQEAADELGVHYMTAYRYVRTGRLIAAQTDGKWRVRRSSVDAFAEPRPPGRTKAGTAKSRAHYERTLAGLLVSGDEAAAWRFMQETLVAALTPEELYLEALGPALHRIGDDWEAGRITIAQEHRASALAYRLIGRIGPSFARPGRKRGHIVLGAPANDHHGLPTALVADVLRGRGFSVSDLGAHTPAASFAETIADTPNFVGTGVVVSAPIGSAAIAATVAAIKSAGAAPVLLGGVTITDEQHARRLGADGWTDSSRAAAEWFDAAAARRITATASRRQ